MATHVVQPHTGERPTGWEGSWRSPLKPYPDSELWLRLPGLRGHDLGPDTAPETMKGGTGPGRQASAQDVRVALIPYPFVELYKLYQTAGRISCIRLKR